MPKVFAITASTNSITLNEQGRGEVAFTVSNTSGGKLRGRAVVRTLGSTQSDWLRVVDESERDFDSQTVHQFTVEVAVPQGTPEGTYSFRLDVVSVEDPDEVFDEGPVVAFEVRESEVPAPKPFPWWIVAAVAGFVVVVSIAIWIMVGGAKEYTITASSSDGGTIEPSGTVNVGHGANQEFIIVPSEGLNVADVLVDGKSMGAKSTYTFPNVTEDHTIRAIFEKKRNITASADANGSISPSGNVVVNHGSNRTFTITPNPGYKVQNVLVDGSSVGAVDSYPFNNVTEDHTISATFAKKPPFDPYSGLSFDNKDHFGWYRRFWTGSCSGLSFVERVKCEATKNIPSWDDRINQLVNRVSPQDRTRVQDRLQQLGRVVGHEWARANNIRRIDSRDLEKWGNMLTNSSGGNLESVISDIERESNGKLGR